MTRPSQVLKCSFTGSIHPAIPTIQPSFSPVPHIIFYQSIIPCYPLPRLAKLSTALMIARPDVLLASPAIRLSHLCARCLPWLGRGVCRGFALQAQTFQRRTLKRSLTPLECAVTSKHRVLPGFGRNCPPATPLECAVTKTRPRNPFRMRSSEKRWGVPRGTSGAPNQGLLKNYLKSFPVRACRLAFQPLGQKDHRGGTSRPLQSGPWSFRLFADVTHANHPRWIPSVRRSRQVAGFFAVPGGERCALFGKHVAGED